VTININPAAIIGDVIERATSSNNPPSVYNKSLYGNTLFYLLKIKVERSKEQFPPQSML
jgi:hypothetical protein